PYLKNRQIRVCPDDPTEGRNSYGLNELGFADLTDTQGATTVIHTLAHFQTPAETVMLGDLGKEDDMATDRKNTYKMVAPGSQMNDDSDGRPAARHFQQVDLALMDGHQKPFRLDRFYLNQQPTNKWFTP